jgi:hypothetical protein
MSDPFEKLAAIIQWCELWQADEPHRLACELKEMLEAFLASDHANHAQRMGDEASMYASPDNHIHPDQAVS